MARPTMLLILDGWGWREEREGNAVALARTPNFDRLRAAHPHALLRTCGASVGLPDGQMGNSEVGHLNIGAGRVVKQELPRINEAIRSGELAERLAATGLAEKLKRTGGTAHVLGLVSPGGVHAHEEHVAVVAGLLTQNGVPVAVHAFTDGRDTPPASGLRSVEALEAALARGARIATVTGRYYAMDRDKRWDRTQRAYEAIVLGRAAEVESAAGAVEASYDEGTTDEFVEPVSTGTARVEDGDTVLFANFRADRARQLTEALIAKDFDGFERERRPDIRFVQMTRYRGDFDAPVVFPREIPARVFGAVCAEHGVATLRVAETEKYAHVTYFFNGGEEAAFEGEERILVPSPKVATYDRQPEMSAAEVARRAAEGVRSGRFRAMVLNFANPDMVGHTGDVEATVKACDAVDAALGEVLEALREVGWAALVTADHGNAECLVDPETGGPHTAHTTNAVPCWLVHGPEGRTLREEGSLRDVAPTLLDLLGLEPAQEMTGRSLLA